MNKFRVVSVFLVLIIILMGSYYFFVLDRTAPIIKIDPRKYIGESNSNINIRVLDDKSFIKDVNIEIVQGKKIENINLKNPKKSLHMEYKLDLKKLGFEDGNLNITVSARDSSINNFFQGNIAKVKKRYVLDTHPPTIFMKTHRHYLKIGGSGVAGFSVSEPVIKIGIEVGNYFFPAYKYGQNFCCFFAIPYDVKDINVWVIAVDRAGNKRKIPLNCYVKRVRFRHSNINISDKFLNTKMVQFEDKFKGLTPLEIFLKVNRELRKKDREKLREIGLNTEKKILFKGSFLRMPNAARMASFGDKRTYYHKGKIIDRETHLGIDLASVKRTPIPAANFGRVVYAGWYDIYGNAVIIDHGYGVQSLYGHLSLIGVKKGDFVKKGEIIGRSGATGLAGGDHLHFGMLISGVPVDPVEWWDLRWVKNNIIYNLNQLKEGN